MEKKSVHLPHDLIIEILLRLPVKTIIQFKCVCKSWFSLISSPDFATSHFQLAASPTNKLVCLGKYSKTLSIDFNASLDDDSSYASLSHNFLPIPKIGGSCRGFIFLYIWTNFYIWNPSTGVQTKIPASPLSIFPNAYLYTFLYGFAYDHSTDDYLIFLGSCYRGASYSPASSIVLEIFSLRANKWKQHIEVGSHYPYITAVNCEDGGRVGSFSNGAIYWLVCNLETSNNVIISFDLKEMKLSEISLPYGFGDTYYPLNNCGLSVLGGLISAWSVEMAKVEIWVMQDSSWTKTLVLSMHAPYFAPICFTNCGDIIGRDGEGGLMKFNDKGQLLEHHCCLKGINSKRSQMGVYIESLLSLPCGTEQT